MDRLTQPGRMVFPSGVHHSPEVYGEWPYSFELRDIVKGVVLGGFGYGLPKLLGVRMTPGIGALSGGFTGLAGGFEDIFDVAFAPEGTLPLPGQLGYTDLPHELFQSGLLNIIISASIATLLSFLLT